MTLWVTEKLLYFHTFQSFEWKFRSSSKNSVKSTHFNQITLYVVFTKFFSSRSKKRLLISLSFLVCASMHKLTPKHCSNADNEAFSQFASPQESLRGADGVILSKIHTFNPIFEYVPPELVTLFISNMGGHAPSYVYRLLSELYHPEDYELWWK